jgi:hypothetical protein
MKYMGKSSISKAMEVILTVLWIGVIGTAVIIILAGLIGIFDPGILPLKEQPRDFHIQLIPEGSPIKVETATPRVKEADMTLIAVFDYKIGKIGFVFIFLGGVMVIFFLMIILLDNLRKFFRSLAQGSPFIPINALRLKRVGWLIIIVDLTIFIFYNFWGYILYKSIEVEGFITSIRWESIVASIIGSHMPQIFLGFVVLVIAQVFKEGTEIKEEHQLTI